MPTPYSPGAQWPAATSPPPVELRVTVRPEYVLDDDEGTMIVATLEEVVEDLKLELDGYRSAARELAVEIEAKDRALEASAREMAHELSEGRAEAIREATSRLADRLEKAEKAVERERGDADRGRKACEKLRLLEAELERRMVDMDSDFEEKWAQRVKEANANAEAFKNKLARLEQEMVDVKMSEENARDELKRAKTEIEALTRRVRRSRRASLGTTTTRIRTPEPRPSLVADSSPSSRAYRARNTRGRSVPLWRRSNRLRRDVPRHSRTRARAFANA